MSRFSISLRFSTGLLLTTILATIPTRLFAETAARPDLNLPAQTAVASQPPAKSTPAPTSKTLPIPTPQKVEKNAVPASSTTIGTPNKPATGTSPAPSTKPSVAATGQPPVENVVSLVLKLKERRVYVYKGDKLLKRYPVAVGKKGWETPTGEWQVMEKIRNPAWTSFKTGEVFPAGVENPLGSRWIGFWTDGQDVIGFHGTPNVKSIGTAASHGCVRMRNRDVKALFPLVKVGTVVKVVNE
jgi:lipoprotein-anchoring transpeptidase ErfK/SrfK